MDETTQNPIERAAALVTRLHKVGVMHLNFDKMEKFAIVLDMRIVFSHHALQQMKERRLTETQILRAIEHPQSETKQSPTRIKIVSKITQKKKLYAMIVVYDKIGNAKEIVTAFLSSKLEKYL